jgi:deferrochelatase/peroxidase EfeB
MMYFEFLNKIMEERRKIQDGIKYDKRSFYAKHSSEKNNSQNDCFALLFLRASTNLAEEVKKSIEGLWKMYRDLKKGNSYDLEDCSFPPGGLTVLIAYGQRIFELRGIAKKIPRDFKAKQFLPPGPYKHILPGSGLKYSGEIHDNVGLSEDIALQFISRTQLGTYRAIVETKKYLQKNKVQALKFSKFYTGFQRDDGRSWLGFHDEVSNLTTPKERMDTIAIHSFNNNLLYRDYWTAYGTYLAYLRIDIDLDIWNKIERSRQELIIGRDKLRGSPLIGVDKKGNPIINEGSLSAYDINGFRKSFHDHPDYFRHPHPSNKVTSPLDIRISSEILAQSHIGRTRHMDNIESKHPVSRRLYRQGFEFIEPVYNNSRKQFRVGLNFITFQNDPARLFFILTHPDWMGNVSFGGRPNNKQMHKFASVLVAGVFFVPPNENPFPGASLFRHY